MDRFVLDAVKRELTRRCPVDAYAASRRTRSHYEDIPHTPEGIVDFVWKRRQDAERPVP